MKQDIPFMEYPNVPGLQERLDTLMADIGRPAQADLASLQGQTGRHGTGRQRQCQIGMLARTVFSKFQHIAEKRNPPSAA